MCHEKLGSTYEVMVFFFSLLQPLGVLDAVVLLSVPGLL